MNKRSKAWSIGIKIYYVIMALAVVALVTGKERWLEQGATGSQAGGLFYGIVIVGILIIAPALIMLWFWLRRWMESHGVERQLRLILLVVTVPMMLVIGYMLELVFIMVFIGLGGS